jgi:hypothetical protein
MKAHEAMTKDVITVGPSTAVRDIAALLVRHRISAVPVVSEDGRVIGIVSQTDLGHRSETETEKQRKWWLDLFADGRYRCLQPERWRAPSACFCRGPCLSWTSIQRSVPDRSPQLSRTRSRSWSISW